MKRTEEVWYIANDGARFRDEAECLKRDALIVAVDVIMAPLGARPVDDGCKFANGGGYVQHDAATVNRVKIALGNLTLAHNPWIDVKGTPLENVHPSWWGRMLDDVSDPIETAWRRIYCFDETGREWGQPYYALNPTEGTQAEWVTR